MNRKEAIRQTELLRNLEGLGFTGQEFDQLRRISMTLTRCAERECNGELEVDEDGRAYSVNQGGPWNGWKTSRYPVPNREAGAIKRLGKIMQAHPSWTYYHQGDPRGAALYLINLDSQIYDMPVWEYLETHSIDSIYSSVGICIY